MAEARSTAVSRPTQSFVYTLTWTRRRPALLAIEVAWRWIFCFPVLWFLFQWGSRLLATLPWQQTQVETVSINMLLTDPMKGSLLVATAVDLFMPAVKQMLSVCAIPMILAWCLLSAAGRTWILGRISNSGSAGLASVFRLFGLNLLRIIPMLGTAWLWWTLLSVVARHTVLTGGEPQMMAYVGCALVLTLVLFVLWAVLGWVFGIAPVLSVTRRLGIMASLGAAVGLSKSVRGGLVEVNMVMGVVKIALVVLLMVFSATPLPFQSVTTPEFLIVWTAVVGVLYFVASDFFHVTRLASYLHILQAEE